MIIELGTQRRELTEIEKIAVEPGERQVHKVLSALAERLPLPASESKPDFKEISVSAERFRALVQEQDFSVLKRIDVLPVNLSDFDGTLTSGASGSAIFEYGVKTNFYLPVTREKMNEMLAFFSLTHIDGNNVGQDFMRVLAAFRVWSEQPLLDKHEKDVGTKKVYEMLSWIYAGHTKEEVLNFAMQAFADIGYEQMHFEGAKEVIESLRKGGVATVLISAKFQPILEVAARFFEIPDTHVAGMNLEVDAAGRYTTSIKAPVTYKAGKIIAARELLQQFMHDKDPEAKPLFAMGDSPSKTDQQLLELSHIAVAVEPQTPRDAEYAREAIQHGKSMFIIDYEKTRDGTPAMSFSRHRDTQAEPKGKFL